MSMVASCIERAYTLLCIDALGCYNCRVRIALDVSHQNLSISPLVIVTTTFDTLESTSYSSIIDIIGTKGSEGVMSRDQPIPLRNWIERILCPAIVWKGPRFYTKHFCMRCIKVTLWLFDLLCHLLLCQASLSLIAWHVSSRVSHNRHNVSSNFVYVLPS